MKKVLHTTFFIHLLAMLMALLSVGAAFADGELSGTLESGLHWEIDGTTLRISGEGEMADMTQSSQPWAASKGTITKLRSVRA